MCVRERERVRVREREREREKEIERERKERESLLLKDADNTIPDTPIFAQQHTW